MPVFEYRCKKCQHEFEELVFGREKIQCPRCQGARLYKKLSTFEVGGKGSSLSSSPLERSPALKKSGSCTGPCGSCACGN